MRAKLLELRPKELHIQQACFEWIQLKERTDERYRWFHHSPNGGWRHISTAVALKRSGTRKGFPDWICPVGTRQYRGLVVELKRPGEKPTKEQIEWLTKFTLEGWRVAICFSLEEFISVVEGYFA